MLVTLLAEEGISSLLLPDKIKGEYWVKNQKNGKPLIKIEGSHNQWTVFSNQEIQILDGTGNDIVSVQLQPCNLYSMKENSTNVITHLFAEPTTEDWKGYIRYTINGKQDIHIGRSEANSICIHNIAVSAIHAGLEKKEGRWVIYDKDSVNGIYVNHCRVHGNYLLNPGDIVYIMGFRILIGKEFLAMNHPEYGIILDKRRFLPFNRRDMLQKEVKRKTEPEYYYRSARLTKEEHYFTVKECKEIITKGKSILWERGWRETDFLKVRIGKENTVLDLKSHSITGITGNGTDCLAFAKGILLQLITYYGYDELKIVFLLDEETKGNFKQPDGRHMCGMTEENNN